MGFFSRVFILVVNPVFGKVNFLILISADLPLLYSFSPKIFPSFVFSHSLFLFSRPSSCPFSLQEPQTTVIHNPVDGTKVHPAPPPISNFFHLVLPSSSSSSLCFSTLATSAVGFIESVCVLCVFVHGRHNVCVCVCSPVCVFLLCAAPLCSERRSCGVSTGWQLLTLSVRLWWRLSLCTQGCVAVVVLVTLWAQSSDGRHVVRMCACFHEGAQPSVFPQVVAWPTRCFLSVSGIVRQQQHHYRGWRCER